MRLGVLTWRNRFARVGLVLVMALVLGRLLPASQERQDLTFDLSDISARTRSLRVRVTPEGGAEAVGEFEVNLPSPHPRRFTHPVSVVEGNYRLEVELKTGTDPSLPKTSREYRVTLDGGEVIVFLHEG